MMEREKKRRKERKGKKEWKKIGSKERKKEWKKKGRKERKKDTYGRKLEEGHHSSILGTTL